MKNYHVQGIQLGLPGIGEDVLFATYTPDKPMQYFHMTFPPEGTRMIKKEQSDQAQLELPFR